MFNSNVQRAAAVRGQAMLVCLSSLKHNTFGNKLTKVYNLKHKLTGALYVEDIRTFLIKYPFLELVNVVQI